jgi:hypothetical protein
LLAIREQCTELRELNISSNSEYTSPGIMSLFVQSSENFTDGNSKAQSRPLMLHSANLSKLANLNDDAVILLCQVASGKTMRSLNISSCNLLTDRSLAAIKIHCSLSITELDISFVRNISQAVVTDMVRRCSSLNRLHIWGCTQLKVSELSFFNGLINSYS